jgi:hypothetical protein
MPAGSIICITDKDTLLIDYCVLHSATELPFLPFQKFVVFLFHLLLSFSQPSITFDTVQVF